MNNVTSFVTWDQMIQLGLLLTAVLHLIYAIIHNHNQKK